MSVKSLIIKPVAKRIAKTVARNSLKAIEHQQNIFNKLVQKGSLTKFGQAHGLEPNIIYQDFKTQVPVRDYEQLKTYLDLVVQGEPDILWPGRPKYFAKTSGTTSGSKFIPITQDSMPNHFNSARNALFCQATRLNKFSFLDGKMIFLSGSPELQMTNGIPTGRLSGIVNHAVPKWLRTNQLPSYQTNCIEDWDKKIDQIIKETKGQTMTLISGIPPWVKDYFERLLSDTLAKTVGELFPKLEFVVHGGVNFEPYRSAFNKLIGRPYHNVETYPASEGFIAFQDAREEDGLLLNTNSGIFFEFIPVDQIFDENPERITIKDVQPHVNYAIILSSNAGLWAYNIGDTVEFVSRDPFRIRVTGRIKHFISAFGEHVIAKEVEEAIHRASEQFSLDVSAFTVAPLIDESAEGQSCHQWFIETDWQGADIDAVAHVLDAAIQEQNTYYEDLRNSGMLVLPSIKILKPGVFSDFMKRQGKHGGQNKIPVLSNDRKIARELLLLNS